MNLDAWIRMYEFGCMNSDAWIRMYEFGCMKLRKSVIDWNSFSYNDALIGQVLICEIVALLNCYSSSYLGPLCDRFHFYVIIFTWLRTAFLLRTIAVCRRAFLALHLSVKCVICGRVLNVINVRREIFPGWFCCNARALLLNISKLLRAVVSLYTRRWRQHGIIWPADWNSPANDNN